jgi:non-ribosomal peptide synthetase component F
MASGADLDLAALARSLRLPPSALRIVDLSALPPAVREAEAQGMITGAAGHDLPPRLRVRLEVLPDEPGEAPGELDWLVLGPELPRRVPEKVYASPLDYWSERVPALPPGPSLPVQAQAAPVPLRRRLAELDAETWGELRSRSAWAGLPPAAPLLAALADALAAWSAAPRFTVELSVSGAPGGLWVPLALDGAAPGTFEERARAVQDRLRRDLAHPLPRSVYPEGLPALPVSVTLPARLFREEEGGEETAVPRSRAARGRPGRLGRPGRETALLRLQAAEREGGLLLLWDVAEASFPDGLADALTGAARDALRRLSAAPAWREVRRRLIPPQQLSRMVAFNTTGAPLPEPFLYELVAARARRQPDRTAVTGPGGAVTYGELLRVADRLGHLLQRAGARRNAPVAVALEPGWEAVAALLGILSAGAACLPVDPALPRDRFRARLEHGRIELAVTREALADALDWPEEIVGVVIEDAAAGDLPDGPPAVPSASPKDLACILFGPDGPVMLENRGAANLVTDLNRRFGIGTGDRTLALAPLSAGRSLYEVFGTLAAGATLVVAAEDGAEITVLAASPSFVESRLDAGVPLPRVVLLDGGPVPAGLAERIRRARPGARVARLRGALEVSVWTAVHEIGDGEEAGSRPFGQPVANQSVHVLDGRMELRPFWVPGDLYVGGIGLARGYWRDPERSAVRFAIHPDTGERLFRTGDRARWLPGGEIELLETDP